MNPVEHLSKILNEVVEPPRSESEKRFMKKHEPEIITDPAVEDFFVRLAQMGYEPYSRLADVKPEVAKLVYESRVKGETVIGVFEDTGDNISLIRSNRVNGYQLPRYTMAVVKPCGNVSKLADVALAMDINKSPGMSDYLKKMAFDIVGGDRKINWVIDQLKPLDPDSGVPTHVRAQEKMVGLSEAYASGSVKLKDGSSTKLSGKDATLLNKLLDNLNATNRKKMVDVLLTDPSGFEEIMSFAKEYEE